MDYPATKIPADYELMNAAHRIDEK